jgi:hypothetical protein
MTRDEANKLEQAIAKVIASERRAMKFELDREMLALRRELFAAEQKIAALERDLAAVIETRGVAADHASIDSVSFLHRRQQ